MPSKRVTYRLKNFYLQMMQIDTDGLLNEPAEGARSPDIWLLGPLCGHSPQAYLRKSVSSADNLKSALNSRDHLTARRRCSGYRQLTA